jgi:hypothetical protein
MRCCARAWRISNTRSERAIDDSLNHRLRQWLLYVGAALSLARLLGFGFEYAGQTIQTDFAAYYTAGQMIEAGLSPYRYLITPERIIWTSGDQYQHSQYIYPPLLAALFAPVTRLFSYLTAKYLWWFVDLICVAVVLELSRRALRLAFQPWVAAQLVFAGLFHPLVIQLLRGQIDLVTAAVLGLAFWLLARRRREGLAGGLLGTAALIKFHAGFVFPFLLIRRKWWTSAGFVLAAGAMAVLNLLVAGPANVRNYLAELPRISQYGGDGPPESRFTPEQLALTAPLFPDSGGVIKDGFLFPNTGFKFVTNASFVELICCGVGFNLSRAAASLAVLAFFVVAIGLLCWRGYAVPLASRDEYVFWFAVINVALLAGPTTWTMNVVWLLPGFAILVYLWRSAAGDEALQLATLIFMAGLLLVAMPDHRAFPALFPESLVRLSIYKYPLGELLMILGSFVFLRRRPRQAAQP